MLPALVAGVATVLLAGAAAQAAVPDSPCPNVFQYVLSPRGVWKGHVWARPPSPPQHVHLRVQLSLEAVLPSKYVGRISLMGDENTVARNILAGSQERILYELLFPLRYPLPQVDRITMNGQLICEGSYEGGQTFTKLFLEHTLYLIGQAASNNIVPGSGLLGSRSSSPQTNVWVVDLPHESASPKPSSTPFSTELQYNGPFVQTPKERQKEIKPTTFDSPSSHSAINPQPPALEQTTDDGRCGQPLDAVPLITHGRNTSRGQWPWHAALYRAEGPDLKYSCGGTLVSLRLIVTAAHCATSDGKALHPDSIVPYLGKHHLHKWTANEAVQQGKVQAIHVHPEYSPSNFSADVAVLKLSAALKYTQFVRPACLWRADEPADLESVVGEDGYVVGWGFDEGGALTPELRMTRMRIVSEAACLRSYPEFFSRFSSDRSFCAGFRNGSSACNGDSGGAMVLPRARGGESAWLLRGVVSVSVRHPGDLVCDARHYIVFTDLAKLRGWVARFL